MAAPGTVADSKHNFSASGTSSYKGTGDQICIYCHAPHNNAGGTPLWNRVLNAATYTVYASPTLNATITLSNPPAIL